MDEREWSAENDPGPEPDVMVSNTVAGVVRGRDVSLKGAAAMAVLASRDLSLEQAGCGAVLANGGVSIRYGGCGPLLANGDVSIEYGGTQVMLVAGGARLGPGSFVGFVASPKMTVEEGGKVLFGTRQAIAFGAAAGLALAVGLRLFRR